MAKTWPSPIFEKNFFPAENAGNMPEIAVCADFHRAFSLQFVVFSHKNIINNNAHHKAWFIFQKTYFPAENAGNMPEKPVFWHFLEISPLVFFYFFAQTGILGMLNTWPSPIFEKNFFPAENTGNNAGNRRFSRLSFDFFLIFRCFFTQKHY